MTMRGEEREIPKANRRPDQTGGDGEHRGQRGSSGDVAAIGASEIPSPARREAAPKDVGLYDGLDPDAGCGVESCRECYPDEPR